MPDSRNRCNVCNQDFATPEELREHQARHHTPEGKQAQAKDRSQDVGAPEPTD